MRLMYQKISKTHKYYEIEKFKKITRRILLSSQFSKNIKNIKFCLSKKAIKMRCLNINREITKLNSLTTKNSRNNLYIHCRQKN